MIQISQRWWHRVGRWVSSSRPGAWLFSHIGHRIDRTVLRWSNGRYAVGTLITGLPLIVLTTTGAKSSQPRAVPLVAIPDGPRLIVIASSWGRAKHPAWYYNLLAKPQAQVMLNGRSQTYRAHETTGPERETCWQTAVALYPGYSAYQTRTGGRQIPVMVLTPQP